MAISRSFFQFIKMMSSGCIIYRYGLHLQINQCFIKSEDAAEIEIKRKIAN